MSLFFTPNASKHQGELCEGVLLSVIDRHAVRSLDTGIAVIHTIHRMYPHEFRWREDWDDPALTFFDKLAGGTELRYMIGKGASLDECLAFEHQGEDKFLALRGKYLLYGEGKR